MGLARKLEKRLERLVDGLSATLFRGGIHPVDLAGRLVREADLQVTDVPDGQGIPNKWVIRVNPEDMVESMDVGELESELGNALLQTASERNWNLAGPAEVLVIVDPVAGTGSPTFESSVVPGELAVWGQLITLAGDQSFELIKNRVVIGRSTGADVMLGRPEVSRQHAMIYRQSGAVWVNDLRSSNGTLVNGVRIDGVPRQVRGGDYIQFGPIAMTLRLLG